MAEGKLSSAKGGNGGDLNSGFSTKLSRLGPVGNGGNGGVAITPGSIANGGNGGHGNLFALGGGTGPIILRHDNGGNGGNGGTVVGGGSASGGNGGDGSAAPVINGKGNGGNGGNGGTHHCKSTFIGQCLHTIWPNQWAYSLSTFSICHIESQYDEVNFNGYSVHAYSISANIFNGN